MEYDMDEIVKKIEIIEATQMALLRELNLEVHEDPYGCYIRLSKRLE